MDIDMSATRQQMLETAEHLNQQMTDGIPFTWETLEQALTSVTEQDDKGIHGWICYFAAFYQLTTGNQEDCLHYLDESVRCLLGTDQEHHVARVYNMIGIVAHMQNNLSLAMEQYDKALDYTEKYDDKMVHSIVLSNMSGAYYLIGAYERAVQCHAECIREFEQADDNSTYSRINFRKMLAEYGCCLLHLHMDDEAEKVLCKLEETGQSEEVIRETRLGVNVFLAYLAERNGDRKKAEEHVRTAIMALEDMTQVSSEYDSIQNLLQYVEYAPVIAYQWIASNKPLYEIAGFQLLARLFANGKEPNDRGINEFLDQAAVALQGDNMGVKHAAANAVMRFCDFGEDFEKIAQGALKGIFEI